MSSTSRATSAARIRSFRNSPIALCADSQTNTGPRSRDAARPPGGPPGSPRAMRTPHQVLVPLTRVGAEQAAGVVAEVEAGQLALRRESGAEGEDRAGGHPARESPWNASHGLFSTSAATRPGSGSPTGGAPATGRVPDEDEPPAQAVVAAMADGGERGLDVVVVVRQVGDEAGRLPGAQAAALLAEVQGLEAGARGPVFRDVHLEEVVRPAGHIRTSASASGPSTGPPAGVCRTRVATTPPSSSGRSGKVSCW
ncbi:MAG: hypothetical protein JWP66_289 [Naasia sp.]|nr:hypothetical protein [Naasia sp.]